MSFKVGFSLILVAFVLSAWMDDSSFVDTAAVKEKSSSAQDKSDSSDESAEDNKEKKAAEEIMFGNQQKQNKMRKFMNDIMGMNNNPEMADVPDSKRASDSSELKNSTDSNEEDDKSAKLEDAFKDEEKKDRDSSNASEEMEHELGKEAWYNNNPLPDGSGLALQYVMNHSPQPEDPSPNENVNPLYDQEEVDRRKRQLAYPLRKRSLRSPLGQMIQSRGRRLPRRSMRYKRQVKLEDLLNLLGKSEVGNAGRFYEEQSQFPSTSQNAVHFRNSEYGYPYSLDRNEAEEMAESADEDIEPKDDITNSLYFSALGKNFEHPDFAFPYSPKPDESSPPVQYPEWLDRESPRPSMFSVSRRSSPFFYPLDYRYVPGYKKKRTMLVENDEPDDSNFGKWGRVVQMPNEYASPEEVAKLYALANLLTGGDDQEERKRRSA